MSFGQHAVGGVGLGVDPFDPAALDEVVDIGAAEGCRDGVVDGGDGDAQGAGLFPVHVDPVFGHVFHAVGPDFRQALVLCRHAEELVAGRHQLLVAEPAPVQQLEVEPGGVAQLARPTGGGKANTRALRI